MGNIINQVIAYWFLMFIVNCQCGQSSKLSTQESNLSPVICSGEAIVFMGNPGAGKSTLCNSIFGKTVFRSGFSLGTGLSRRHQTYVYDGKLYIDTPGLFDMDPEMCSRAMQEIKKALSYNNKHYKLIFVIVIVAGTVYYDDLTTINMICKSIKTDFEYGIIFNNIEKKTLAKLETNEDHRKVWDQAFKKRLNKQPVEVLLLGRDVELADMDDAYLSSDNQNRDKLINFINRIKAYKIDLQESFGLLRLAGAGWKRINVPSRYSFNV
eukprot:gene3035-3796_t